MPIRRARSVSATADDPANQPANTKAKAENPATYAFIRAPNANCKRGFSPIFAVASAIPKTERGNPVRQEPRISRSSNHAASRIAPVRSEERSVGKEGRY